MSNRFTCTRCGAWFEPDPEECSELEWSSECPACLDGQGDDDPETEQDRIDAAGDDLFHSMREDGLL